MKKNVLQGVLQLFCVALMMFAYSACGGSDDDENNNKSTYTLDNLKGIWFMQGYSCYNDGERATLVSFDDWNKGSIWQYWYYYPRQNYMHHSLEKFTYYFDEENRQVIIKGENDQWVCTILKLPAKGSNDDMEIMNWDKKGGFSTFSRNDGITIPTKAPSIIGKWREQDITSMSSYMNSYYFFEDGTVLVFTTSKKDSTYETYSNMELYEFDNDAEKLYFTRWSNELEEPVIKFSEEELIFGEGLFPEKLKKYSDSSDMTLGELLISGWEMETEYGLIYINFDAIGKTFFDYESSNSGRCYLEYDDEAGVGPTSRGKYTLHNGILSLSEISGLVPFDMSGDYVLNSVTKDELLLTDSKGKQLKGIRIKYY